MRKLWLIAIIMGLANMNAAMAQDTISSKSEPQTQYIWDHCSKLNTALAGTHSEKSEASLELALSYLILTGAPTNFTLQQMYDKLNHMFKEDPKFLGVYLLIIKECKQSPDKAVSEVIKEVMHIK